MVVDMFNVEVNFPLDYRRLRLEVTLLDFIVTQTENKIVGLNCYSLLSINIYL